MIKMKFRSLLDQTILLLFSLGALNWILVTSRLTDLDPHDEGGQYIPAGISGKNFPFPEWGPLYSLWYRLLWIFQKDLVELYYLSGSLILVGVVVAYFLFLGRIRMELPARLTASFLLLLNPFFLLINRRPNHFGVLIILVFFLLAILAKGKSKTEIGFLWPWGAGFLLGAYIRPEYFLSFLICLAGALALTLKNWRKSSWKEKAGPAAFLLSFVLLIRFFQGTPLIGINSSGSKVVGVFLLKNFERYEQDSKGFLPLDPMKFAKDLYRDPQNIFQAFLNNPGEFRKHVIYNGKKYVQDLSDVLFSYSYLLSSFFFKGMLFLSGMWALVKIKRAVHDLRKDGGISRIRVLFQGPPWEFYFFVFLAVFPFIFSSLLFGSLTQYWVSQFPFFLALFPGLLFSVKFSHV